MKMRSIMVGLIALVTALVAADAGAQKVKNLEGEYTYMQPSDQDLDEAKAYAVGRAQTEAIAREFGTLVMSKGITRINNGEMSYVKVGENEVKAEWIADNRSPEFKFDMDPATGRRVIRVKVWFKAREIISKAVEVEANVLRNGTSMRNVDDRFFSGDQMYLHFKAPVDGYLVVYEVGESEQVNRLLPYSSSREASFRVEGNKDYILFSIDKSHLYNGQRATDVDEILFTAEKPVEYDRICVLFSPNEIMRPADVMGGKVSGAKVGVAQAASLTLPRQLSFEKFQKWLAKSRLKDIQLRYVPIEIEITRKK